MKRKPSVWYSLVFIKSKFSDILSLILRFFLFSRHSSYQKWCFIEASNTVTAVCSCILADSQSEKKLYDFVSGRFKTLQTAKLAFSWTYLRAIFHHSRRGLGKLLWQKKNTLKDIDFLLIWVLKKSSSTRKNFCLRYVRQIYEHPNFYDVELQKKNYSYKKERSTTDVSKARTWAARCFASYAAQSTSTQITVLIFPLVVSVHTKMYTKIYLILYAKNACFGFYAESEC